MNKLVTVELNKPGVPTFTLTRDEMDRLLIALSDIQFAAETIKAGETMERTLADGGRLVLLCREDSAGC